MKIVAPIRQLDEIAALARAGANELYCGVTPREWAERFGGASANRRPGGNLPSLAALAYLHFCLESLRRLRGDAVLSISQGAK